MKKKKIIHIFTILVLCILLTAFNHNSAKSFAKTSATVSGSGDTITLTMDKASEANTIAHLLEKYKTVTYAQLDYKDCLRCGAL
jgi:homoserine kinase